MGAALGEGKRMGPLMRRGMLLLLLAVGVVPAWTAAPVAAQDRDCSDFSSQREARLFFLRNGGPGSDPHRLDTAYGQGDGIACESRPCPCYYGRSLPDSDPTPNRPPQRDTRPRNRRQTIKSRVIDVIDGDTIRVRTLEPTRRPTYRVRLIGIDTPEMRPLECGAREATHALRLELQ
jgi:hypothetical protein